MHRIAAVLALLLTGCLDPESVSPNPGRPDAASGMAADRLTVYGQNIYVGADVDAVFAALVSPSPDDDFPALLEAIAVLGRTDFTRRAAAIATEVARTRPHLASFHEISRIDIDLGPLGIPVAAHEDFLPELLGALAARGLDYGVAAIVQNVTAAPFPGISLVDFDVLLVDRTRVTVGPGIVARNFSTNLGQVAPGVNLIRGWVSIPVTVGGRSYRVAATHPEPDIDGYPSFALLRAAQLTEMLSYLPPGTPTILLGDFNDVVGSPMYQIIRSAGFVDLWAELRNGREGLTCCHEPTLDNALAAHSKRIDYVFARGFEGPQGAPIGSIDIYGDNPSARFAGPSSLLWPADHAGLIAKLVTLR